MDIVALIKDYGFPVVAVFFLAYFIWFLYTYIVQEIKPKLAQTSATLIKLIDRIRILAVSYTHLTLPTKRIV